MEIGQENFPSITIGLRILQGKFQKDAIGDGILDPIIRPRRGFH